MDSLKIKTESHKESADDFFDIDWGRDALIPEGEYQAVYVSHEISRGSFGTKLKITFRIVSFGEFFETLIPAWYNISDAASSKRKGGRIKVNRGHKLTTELLRVLQIKARIDRLSPSLLKGHILLIKVRTVTKNSYQKKLAPPQQYSIVDSLVCILNLQDISRTPKVLPKPIPEPIPTIKPDEPDSI
jgi:hypothetical protein